MTLHPTHNQSLIELDRRSFLHPYTALADHDRDGVRVVAEGEGCWIRDLDGVRYLDATAGLWCVNVGHGRAEIADAIQAQAKKLAFYHSFSSMGNEPSIRLADRVIRHAGLDMSKVFFGSSGSDANDTNVKLVWYYNALRGKPDKVKIISRERGYHGVTVASGSLTGIPLIHKGFHLPLPEVKHTTCPDRYRGKPASMSDLAYAKKLAGDLDELIRREGPETVGAFIAEPVMGTGGVLVPPEGYFEAIREVLDRHDVLMIADEVICGFGRLGTWFGAHRYDLRPDLMTCAKGLTSAYLPMSASLVHERIWRVLLDHAPEMGVFGHGFTYSAHPVCAAAALANLDIIEREGLVERAGTVGALFQARMQDAFGEHPLVGDVRGEGLILGVELVADKANRTPFPLDRRVPARIMKFCLEEGLILRGLPGGNTMAFSPPLIIRETEIEQIALRFGRALAKAEAAFRADGTWSG